MGMRDVQEAVSKFGQMFETAGEKDAVDLLKDDHRKVDMLFSQFERARSNKQNILDQIIKELSIHATIEEDMVYPLLADSRKSGERTGEAYEEHHVVKMMLAELADMPADREGVKAKVKVLKELVHHHVKEEEMMLLPQLKRSGTDLDRLAQDILRRKQQLMTAMSRGGGVGKNKDRKALASSASVRKTGTAKRKSAAGTTVRKSSGTRTRAVRRKSA